MAMQNTRKEAAERLAGSTGNSSGPLARSKGAAEKAVAQLMDELSQFGDAAKGAGRENNEFDQIWNDAVPKLDTLDGEQKQQTLAQMERVLYRLYEKTLAEEKNLPLSIVEVLQTQAKELEPIAH